MYNTSYMNLSPSQSFLELASGMGDGDGSIASWTYSLPDESFTLINVTLIGMFELPYASSHTYQHNIHHRAGK
jgi:hypothetical protein